MAYRVFEAVAVGGLSDPLCRFLVRANQKRLWVVLGDQICQQRCAAQHTGLCHRYGLGQCGYAVQVRVHGDDGVKQFGQKAADNALTHDFARLEGDVLSHIRQIGCNQREVECSQVAGSACGQHQLHQLFVGVVQCAQQHHTFRQGGG